jgi:hypothetical protein
VSPVTVQVVLVVEHVAPPCVAVTVYPVMGEPPSETGAVHDTVVPPSIGAALTEVGGPGFLGPLAPAGAAAMVARTVAARSAESESPRTFRTGVGIIVHLHPVAAIIAPTVVASVTRRIGHRLFLESHEGMPSQAGSRRSFCPLHRSDIGPAATVTLSS